MSFSSPRLPVPPFFLAGVENRTPNPHFSQQPEEGQCRLPPASLEQATGIPDRFKMSPRMWIEKGFPYMIGIDRSIECHRDNPLDTRQVITLAMPIVMSGPIQGGYGWPGGTRR